MRVTMLGCGNSNGVPLIGCDCKTCKSDNPKNKRTRVSSFIEINNINILIDTSPDLRQQALRHDIRRIDAVLYTHDHADHTHGIDELRCFNYLSGNAIPVWGNQPTMELLQQRFHYVFQSKPEFVWYRPCISPHTIADAAVTNFDVLGVPVVAFEQHHGKGKTLGYRIGNFGYSTDVDRLPESAFEALKGIDVWFVDCLRYTESHSHSNLRATMDWIKIIKPELAVFIHMAHEFEYDQLLRELPQGVVPGYDGMTLEI